MNSSFVPSRSNLRQQGPQPRHRGQALILAVTIMLLAALISAGFLLVVSGNLNQTARSSDKTRAESAARSGMAFINDRLTYSAKGDNWRPSDSSPIPAPSDRFYYSNVDRAHGWAGVFARFPNPYAPVSDAPQFLANVERVKLGDPDAANFFGALRLTVIGLSPDDASVFSKVVAYKGGSAAPMGRAMRAVTNWDYLNKTVPEGRVTAYDGAGSLTISGTGIFPDAPFSVMIGSPQPNAPLRGAVVEQKVSQTVAGNTVTTVLKIADSGNASFTGANVPANGELVEIAASLGAPTASPSATPATPVYSAVDFNCDNTLDTTEQVDQPISTDNTVPGSVRVNGGLWWFGDVIVNALNGSLFNPTPGNPVPGKVEASGLMAVTDSDKGIAVQGITASGTPLPATQPRVTFTSNDSNFPFSGTVSPQDANSIFSDSFERLRGSSSAIRQTVSFVPPNIASGAGLDRYRELGREPNNQGIYINNPSDIEKIWNGSKYVPMSQAELLRMWISSSTDTQPYVRTMVPNLTTTGSLEEHHLRGWIGQDEFRPRGALIELNPDTKQIAVTLDALDDGATNENGPTGTTVTSADAKAWHDDNGTLLPGVYRKVFNWPTDGVLFAEGNVRVRGVGTTDPGNSLTIVSQGNIYVDGSVNAGTRKVLLLARKNVVVNPTALVSRVEGWTRVDGNNSGSSLNVKDAGVFQVGDWIKFEGNTSYVGHITGISGNTLSLVPDLPTTPSPILPDTVVSAAGTQSSTDGTFVKVGQLTDVFQRHFPNGGLNNVRLAFRDSAEKRAAVQWEFDNGQPQTALALAKSPTPITTTTLVDADKKIVVKQDETATTTPANTDTFLLTSDPDLNTFVTNTTSATPSGAPTPPWNYKPSVLNAYNTIPPFYLTGVGSRKNLVSPQTTSSPWQQDWLASDANLRQSYVATSIVPSVDGLSSDGLLTNTFQMHTDNWGVAPTTTTSVPFIGFNRVGQTDANATGVEDVATTDASFYTDDADNAYALNSRVLTFNTPAATQLFSTLGLTLTRDATTGALLAGFVPTGATNTMPYYRVAGVKVENQLADATDTFTGIAPGLTMNINAFAYAQEGSWFVIPMPYFDRTITNGTDVNRDGVISADEQLAGARFQRYNYKVNFTGAIMENHTAIVNDVDDTAGTVAVPGAVAMWSDRLATYTSDTTTATPSIGVTYNFDPSVANSSLDTDEGFRMPQSNQLIYQN